MPPYGHWMAHHMGPDAAAEAVVRRTVKLPCPLCDDPEPTRHVAGTHRLLCTECIGDIPWDMHTDKATT